MNSPVGAEICAVAWDELTPPFSKVVLIAMFATLRLFTSGEHPCPWLFSADDLQFKGEA